MKTYRVSAGSNSGTVFESDGKTRPLDPRFDLRNHSPDGFAWGYSGSGPAQLALAIPADAIDDMSAVRLYQDFKFKFVSRQAIDRDFECTDDFAIERAKAFEAEAGPR